jgi:hypothetical protein
MTKTPEEVDAKFAAVHAERGYTIGVYFPPEAPWDIVDATIDFIADHVHGADRQGWDAFVVGHAGDHLGIDGEPEGCRHGLRGYWSTGCGCQGDKVMTDGSSRTGHQYCQGETGAVGAKVPASCKFCGAPCQCPCHQAPEAVILFT